MNKEKTKIGKRQIWWIWFIWQSIINNKNYYSNIWYYGNIL